MPQYRLIHLNGPGPADLTRWIFAYAGIPYEDEPIDKEDWPVKRKTVFTGKVSVLMVDDEPLFNSVAIASYAAKVAGLVPEDSFDATLCLAVVGTMQEINFNSWKIWRSNKSVEEKKEEYTSKFFPNAVKPFLERLEERLSGMEWTVSDKITWADLSIALWFGELLDYRPDLLEPFPSVVAAMQKVRDVPGIKHLIETTAKPRY